MASFRPKFTVSSSRKELLFRSHRYSFDTRICLRVHISPFSWINQNCIFKGQNPIKLSTWMIKELSIIPNYLRLFTFVAGTYIFTEKGKICIGLGVELHSTYYIILISATFTSKFSFPFHLYNVKKKSACSTVFQQIVSALEYFPQSKPLKN